jgi:hypothetical protein
MMALLFILSLSALPALASINVKEFCRESTRWYQRALEAVRTGSLHRGCHDVEWMTHAREAICENSRELSEVQIPEKFLFVFDGFAGFNPELGAHYGAVNITRHDENDFGIGYGNGINVFMKSFKEAGGADKTHELHYHATSGFQSRENLSSAIACAKEIKDYLDVIQTLTPRAEQPKWVVFGFSNGGDRAAAFQKKLAEKKNLAIDLVLTVDPVAQWGAFIFDQLKQTIGEKHPLTKRFVNFYQNNDRHSFPGIGLNGKPVRKATHNIHLTPAHLPLLATERYSHSALVVSDLMHELITCELKALDDPAIYCDYSRFAPAN